MSFSYPTEFDIAVFSKNKLCTFYVVRNTETSKYHVFLVVFPENNFNDKRGYVVSSHDDEKIALKQKNKFMKIFKNEKVPDLCCNGTGW